MPTAEILLISRKWPPAVGGMERCIYELSSHLAEHRQVDTIVLPGRKGGRPPNGVALALFGLTASVRLLVRSPAKIVHVADVASWPLGWMASLRAPNSRIVLSAHGSDLSYAKRPGWRSKIYGAYVRLGARLLPRASVIANSTWMAALASEAGWEQVSTIPLATSQRPACARSGHNNSLFFAGRIMRSKGLSFLVEEVLPLLPADIRVRVAGPVWEPNEARLLKNPRVDYLGRLDPNELAREYGAALCTVVPSLGPEGFGLAAVEAAAAGGVVIASNHSGLAEAVLLEAGFLAEAGNATEWTKWILEVAAWRDKKRQAFIAKASAAVSKRYGWSRVVRDTLAVYDAEPRTATAA